MLRFLVGWRLAAILAGLAVAVAVGAVAFDLSAGDLVWGTLALIAVLIPLLAIMARVAVLADDRYMRLSSRVARIDDSLGDGAGSLGDLRARVDRLDETVADAVRRPQDATTLPWPTPVGRTSPVLLLPSAAYHLAEIMPLAEVLNRRGLETRVAIGDAHWARIATGLTWFDTPVFNLPDPDRAVEQVAAVVTMKDWAGYGEVVTAAKAAGVPTFAKVEGAQDFDDSDTPYARAAYRSADHILCQGMNDFEALDGSRFIVGSSRLERHYHAPVMPIDNDHVVINLNFTYGVLETQRSVWIDSAIAACEELGVPYTVAIHPAERRGSRIPRSSTVPISHLLLRASTLVSRFSTVPFEAMARGVPFVYHKPHQEQASTFANGEEAFRTTGSVTELRAALEEARGWRTDYRQRAASFFDRQVNIDPGKSSADRSADVILGILG